MSGITDIAKGAAVQQTAVVDIFEEILKRVRNGERVRVKGFGTFQQRTFPGRVLVTPAVNGGKPIKFEDSAMLKFRQSAVAKSRLNATPAVAEKPAKKGKKATLASLVPLAVVPEAPPLKKVVAKKAKKASA